MGGSGDGVRYAQSGLDRWQLEQEDLSNGIDRRGEPVHEQTLREGGGEHNEHSSK